MDIESCYANGEKKRILATINEINLFFVFIFIIKFDII